MTNMAPMGSDVTKRKHALREELVAQLRSTLAGLERAHRITADAATHEEAKPENDKDTRALEQSYLARGQANRALEARAAVALVQAIPTQGFGAEGRVSLGALVTVDEQGASTTYWIAPEGGGSRLEGGAVQVVTPKSPLGRALLGKAAGDTSEVTLGGRVRVLEIMEVA